MGRGGDIRGGGNSGGGGGGDAISLLQHRLFIMVLIRLLSMQSARFWC